MAEITSAAFYTANNSGTAERLALSFEELAENAVDGILIAALDGSRIEYANRAAHELFGYDYPSRELVGLPSLATWMEQDLPILMELLPQAMAGSWNGEARQKRKDGGVLYTNATAFALKDAAGQPTHLAVTLHDMTKHRRLEEQSQNANERRREQTRLVTQIAQELAGAANLEELYQRIVTQVKEQLGYYHVQLLHHDPTLNAPVLLVGYGEIGKKMLDMGRQFPTDSGLVSAAAASGQTVFRSDLGGENAGVESAPPPLLPFAMEREGVESAPSPSLPFAMEREGVESAPSPSLPFAMEREGVRFLPEARGEMAVPIRLGEQILGILDVYSDRAGALGEDDRILLESLCGQAAIAIQDTQLRQEMEARLSELNTLYRTVSHEGWKAFQATADLQTSLIYENEMIMSAQGSGEKWEMGSGDSPLWNPAMAAAVQRQAAVMLTDYTRGQTAAAAALSVRGQVIGSLGLIVDPENPLTTDELGLLEQVAEQVALALDGARLFAQVQSTLAQTETLYQISSRLAEASQYDEILQAVVDGMAIAEANRAALFIFVYDANGQMASAVIRATWHTGEGHGPTPVGTQFSRADIQHPVFQQYIRPTPLFLDDAGAEMRLSGIESVCLLPLWRGERQLGFVLLDTHRPHHFTEAEIRPAAALAQQMAIAVQSRLLLEEAQARAQRERLLREITTHVRASVDINTILRAAVQELSAALNCKSFIRLGAKDGGDLYREG